MNLMSSPTKRIRSFIRVHPEFHFNTCNYLIINNISLYLRIPFITKFSIVSGKIKPENGMIHLDPSMVK